MKAFLAGVAFAVAVAFASQASALPYCPYSTWHGQNVCTVFEE